VPRPRRATESLEWEKVIAIATLLLAGSRLLCVFTYRLWKSTGALVRRTLKAERELRAYVVVREACLGNTATEPVRAYIVFENPDKTPAYRIAVSMCVGIAETFAALPVRCLEQELAGHLAPAGG